MAIDAVANPYTERFVQEDHERWRIFESDEGIITVQYQVFEDKTKTWRGAPELDPLLGWPFHIAKLVGQQILSLVKELENAYDL